MEAHERRALPEGWEWKKVEDVIEKVPLTGKKLKQSEYQEVGKFPVIDQGQSFMGGYTDKEALKVCCESPVIIFGDHTKAIKYVDFDFIAGADGIQVMKPKKVFHPKLFYYFVRAIQLPDKGYARHFQLLEKSQIPLPLQQKFARIVEKIEAMRQSQNQSKQQIEDLFSTLMQKAFRGEL
ncbi:MAG: restriction endonuclease subunit S [Candidatus Methanoperedens sp.]|nr:restriction endonuclease subunit S [Candidatus Methanoperedens sp.]